MGRCSRRCFCLTVESVAAEAVVAQATEAAHAVGTDGVSVAVMSANSAFVDVSACSTGAITGVTGVAAACEAAVSVGTGSVDITVVNRFVRRTGGAFVNVVASDPIAVVTTVASTAPGADSVGAGATILARVGNTIVDDIFAIVAVITRDTRTSTRTGKSCGSSLVFTGLAIGTIGTVRRGIKRIGYISDCGTDYITE